MAENENRTKKVIAAGSKAVDLADKGISFVDNLASIFIAIKWIIIACILGAIYMTVSWFANLIPSSEDVSKAADAAKVAVVKTVEQTKAATIDGATKLKAASIENVVKAKVAYDASDTKVQVGKLVDESTIIATDLKIALDESPAFNDAKHNASVAVDDIKAKASSYDFKGAFSVLTGKATAKPAEEVVTKDQPVAPVETKVNYDEQ